MSHGIFLSYNSRDREQVLQIWALLERQGLPAFIDQQALAKGARPIETLERELTSASIIVVFIGPHAIGPWQRHEIALALAVQNARPGISVIPVYLPGSETVLSFITTNTYVDLRVAATYQAEIDQLIATLRDRIAVKRPRLMPCPYRRLTSYTETDHEFFFGRDTESSEVVAAVERYNCVVLLGPSGVGKSSLIRAGVTPRLESRAGVSWHVAYCRPYQDPFGRVARALLLVKSPDLDDLLLIEQGQALGAQLRKMAKDAGAVQTMLDTLTPDGLRLLLAIDQLEDVDQVAAETREAFIDFLASVALSGQRLLLCLRTGFYEIVEQFEDRLPKASVTHCRLSPMTETQLAAAIEGPAARLGVTLEAGLVGQLVHDAIASPGALPLLAFALSKLWALPASTSTPTITNLHYATLGGLRQIISRHAEEARATLRCSDDVARRALLRLVNVREGRLDQPNRARVPLDDFLSDEQTVIRVFIEQRLIVSDSDDGVRDIVEYAHDEIIRAWSTLAGWVNELVPLLGVRSDIRRVSGPDARATVALTGRTLEDAVRLLRQRPDLLTAPEAALVRKWRFRSRAIRYTMWTVVGVITGLSLTIAIVLRHRNAELRRDGWIVAAQEHVRLAETLWPPGTAMREPYASWSTASGHLVREGNAFVAEATTAAGNQRLARIAELLRDLDAASRSIDRRVALTGRIAEEDRLAARDWQAVIEDLAKDPRYGTVVRPVEGLVPLRKNAGTGLWEFWHVQSGTRPGISADGRLQIRADTGIAFVLVPAGGFTMGAAPPEDPYAFPDEVDQASKRPFEVTIDHAIFVGAHELTQGQFMRAAGENPSYFSRTSGDPAYAAFDLSHPVEQVTFVEAAAACRRLGLDLPTEAEWEYVARAGTHDPWWSGPTIASVSAAGNTADETHGRTGRPPDPKNGPADTSINDAFENTAPVGRFRPNPWGLFDTIGNVWEWTKTPYGPYGATASGTRLVIRGGSWGSGPRYSRSTTRNKYQPSFRFYSFGFRPVKRLR